MNNIFNIKRFGLVFRKDFMENWKRYILFFLTMIGIMVVITTWQSFEFRQYSIDSNRYHNRDLLISFSLMFAAFGILFASTFMNPMNSKLKKITYLVNPSSTFEKYLSRWITITIGYIISFFIALWIADTIRIGICSAYPIEGIEIVFLDLTKLIWTDGEWSHHIYLFDKKGLIISISIYLLFQSILILGSTFWEKATFIKTFTACALIVILYILICRQTILIFYEDFDMFVNVLSSFEIDEGNVEQVVLSISSIVLIFAIINWTLAYFRFRESEIIKRL